MYQSVKPEVLCALYAVSDACLISSTRDGLNLVSYEYVACQVEQNGVLVLSQYAGAAKMLPSSVFVNPWDTPRFAETIAKVLVMPADERARRQREAKKVVDQRTRYVVKRDHRCSTLPESPLSDVDGSAAWGKSFLHTLTRMELPKNDPGTKLGEHLDHNAEQEKAIETRSDVVDIRG